MQMRFLFQELRQFSIQYRKGIARLVSSLGVLALLLAFAPMTMPVAHAAYPGTNGKIAFTKSVSGNEDIYVMNADGSNVTRLTTNAAVDQAPRWSPDGSKIVFASTRDGNYEIYAMNADGSSQTRVTNNSALDANPSWSPDGSKILFYSQRDGNDEIYIMNADGTKQTNLTNNPAGDVVASFSPDGTKIVFQSLRSGTGHIYVMNADGSNVTPLTSGSYHDGSANWSPDGTKIAFHSDRVGNPNTEIYTMNADGSAQTQRTSNVGQDTSPAWSPDGTKIIFVGTPSNQEIFVMNEDGSGQTNLTGTSDTESAADWQPNYNIAMYPGRSFETVSGTSTLNLSFLNTTDLYGYQMQVNYDSSKVSASGAFVNTFFDTTTNASVPSGWNASCSAGVCKFAASKVSPATALTGSGVVAQITFTGVAAGESALTISSDIWSDQDAATISHTKNTATVTVYGTGSVTGTANLQGRATPLDATGTLTFTDPTMTFLPTILNFGPSSGSFEATVPALAGGTTYDIVGAHSLYLSNAYSDLSIAAGGSANPSPATTKLLGGDANNDGAIGLGDLTCIGGAFGGAAVVCGTTGSSDINADSTTNILDLVLTGGNYGKSGTQTWE